MSNVPQQGWNEGQVYLAIDTFIEESRRVTRDEFYAVLAAPAQPFKCIYHLEYACYSTLESSILLGIVDCVRKRYYIHPSWKPGDILKASTDPFEIFSTQWKMK